MNRYNIINTCRSCINRKYALKLERADCYYLQYPAKCVECGEICNIVTKLTLPAMVRLWLRRIIVSVKEK